MKSVAVTGWKPGFDKIETNNLLRLELGYSLREAKYAVDDILDGKEVNLAVQDDRIDHLVSKFEALGLVLEVRAE
jgi:hypothetical protein